MTTIDSLKNELFRDVKEQHDRSVYEIDHTHSETARAVMTACTINTLNQLALANFAAEGLRLILDKGDEVANALWAIAEALEEEKGGADNADC